MALQEEFESQGNFLFRHRSILPLVIIIVGLFVFSINRYLGITYDLTLPYSTLEYCCLGVCLFGLFIRVYTVGYTPANTSGRNTHDQVADTLNTTGIYSVVRHPLYVGNFFMWLGIALMTEKGWFVVSFILMYWLYYERIMYAEEQFLRRKFGENYLNWAAKTPAVFFSFKNKKKPNYPFSWKKVLKKEKNGLLAIFILLYIFHTIADSIDSQYFQPEMNWLAFATLICGLSYMILKFMKKKTNLLNEAGR